MHLGLFPFNVLYVLPSLFFVYQMRFIHAKSRVLKLVRNTQITPCMQLCFCMQIAVCKIPVYYMHVRRLPAPNTTPPIDLC